jgi:hypothetical protein
VVTLPSKAPTEITGLVTDASSGADIAVKVDVGPVITIWPALVSVRAGVKIKECISLFVERCFPVSAGVMNRYSLPVLAGVLDG